MIVTTQVVTEHFIIARYYLGLREARTLDLSGVIWIGVSVGNLELS